MRRWIITCLGLLGASSAAAADEALPDLAVNPAADVALPGPDASAAAELAGDPTADLAAEPVRHPDLALAQIMRGPFHSSRLFTVPTADVVGAYVLTISGDGSLLQQTGVLTSAGVLAIGFGDIAQLEYRHTAAISVTGVHAPLPAVGVQVKVPLPRGSGIPAIGVALRLGVPRRETFGGTAVDETVHDFYVIGRLRFDAARWLTLHGGARVSSASIELSGDRTVPPAAKTLVLPAAGIELAMNAEARLVAEVALAPQFMWMAALPEVAPQIGRGVLGRLGLRWTMLPALIIDGSLGYQHELGDAAGPDRLDAVVHWDIRLGAEVFVPWGALACRATGVFCDSRGRPERP
ncbi:MAG: hypothetical protein M3680_24350 [Myxococcota bacterium]|nr:hypothetical protein [Myxococcota bacterium]